MHREQRKIPHPAVGPRQRTFGFVLADLVGCQFNVRRLRGFPSLDALLRALRAPVCCVSKKRVQFVNALPAYQTSRCQSLLTSDPCIALTIGRFADVRPFASRNQRIR